MGVTIDLRIDELVLDGFPAARRDGIERAFRRELERGLYGRLARPEAVPERSVDSASASIRYSDEMSDAAIGARIARATLGTIAAGPGSNR